MNHFVYIIKSLKDGTYYKGYTTDYIKRLEHHNKGLSRYTRSKTPWKLIYLEKYKSKTEALIREKQIKKYNRKYIHWLCQQPSNIVE